MSALYRQHRQRGGRWPTRIAGFSVLLLVLAALLLAGAGPAYRLDLLTLGGAFNMLRLGGLLGLGAIAVALLALLVALLCRRKGVVWMTLFTTAATVALLAIPWMYWQRAQSAPPIHDITTDLENPPEFVALAPAREAAPNAVDYPGESFARRQRRAYPDIQPRHFPLPLATVRAAAEAAVLDMGWEIADISIDAVDTIEATATTRWFGFKDDVVIRLTQESDGIRVDVRSASRLGRGDAGANAKRIQDYFDALERRTG
ncbi:DUF1499 domain-containing protein [Halomonas sp. LR3S48]|uniref:DUF1499 domain-containing protein n=1 Tax=Halomonas sp. LR3S48 TaxID=2982694 RepID=UPI0021E4C5CF|nr:DUF1499 domain-containing protein [Halomonas sp. LR3S48]UYG03064.1 DUF1499 domain-containing protein [Halomonas sp. LR3S48]